METWLCPWTGLTGARESRTGPRDGVEPVGRRPSGVADEGRPPLRELPSRCRVSFSRTWTCPPSPRSQSSIPGPQHFSPPAPGRGHERSHQVYPGAVAFVLLSSSSCSSCPRPSRGSPQSSFCLPRQRPPQLQDPGDLVEEGLERLPPHLILRQRDRLHFPARWGGRVAEPTPTPGGRSAVLFRTVYAWVGLP